MDLTSLEAFLDPPTPWWSDVTTALSVGTVVMVNFRGQELCLVHAPQNVVPSKYLINTSE